MHAYVGSKFKIEAFKETGVVGRFGGLTDSLRTRELKKWARTYHRKDVRKLWGVSLGLPRRREELSGYSADVGEYKTSMVKVKTLSSSVAMWASKTQPEERNKVSDQSLGWDQMSLGWMTPQDEDCYSYEPSEYSSPVRERSDQASSHNSSEGIGTDSAQ